MQISKMSLNYFIVITKLRYAYSQPFYIIHTTVHKILTMFKLEFDIISIDKCTDMEVDRKEWREQWIA